MLLCFWWYRTTGKKLRKKDQQLLAREELFSNLSRNVDDVFLMIDTETRKVEYVSPNVQRILGLSPEAVQEDLYVLYPAGDDSGASRLENLMQMEQGVQQEWEREFVNQETGEPRYIHVTGFINDVQGARKCIVDLSDRTGEHQTTLAVEAALEVAEKASKAKTDFLSNMSHDIRTPMNAIIGITTLMKNELHQPEKLAEHLGKLETSGRLLLGIINDILDMSRIESGKTTLNIEKTNLPPAGQPAGQHYPAAGQPAPPDLHGGEPCAARKRAGRPQPPESGSDEYPLQCGQVYAPRRTHPAGCRGNLPIPSTTPNTALWYRMTASA